MLHVKGGRCQPSVTQSKFKGAKQDVWGAFFHVDQMLCERVYNLSSQKHSK